MMRLPRRRRWQLRDDEGVSIIEVMVACLVLGVVVLSVAGGLGSGMGLVGHSRQRTAGAGVAQERLERARNVAYDDLALNQDPTYSSLPGHPDGSVIENGPGSNDDEYRLSDGTEEPLIIDTADGGLRHLDDPFTLAQTEFSVYQFVTWVDDPSPDLPGTQDYKRVIVVVTWKFPVHSGPKHTVVESTFVTDGTVNLPTPTPTASAAPPTAPPGGGNEALGVGAFMGELTGPLAPPSNGTGPCTEDVTRPEVQSAELLSGSEGYLNSTSVQVRVKARDLECHPLTLYMANKASRSECTDPTGYSEVQQIEEGAVGGDPPAVLATWTIPAGDGFKAVCVVVRNKRNEVSALARSDVWGVNVKLDQTLPTVPGNFAEATCTIKGNDRVATFDWNAATDENLGGYHLYRSLESSEYVLVTRVSDPPSPPDSSLKSYASVRYLVRAFDKAGNESGDSAVASYAKNEC